MKKIINKYKSRLVFPKYDLVIDTNEIKEVSDVIFYEIIHNSFIDEILPKTIKDDEEFKKIGKNKNRKISV